MLIEDRCLAALAHGHLIVPLNYQQHALPRWQVDGSEMCCGFELIEQLWIRREDYIKAIVQSSLGDRTNVDQVLQQVSLSPCVMGPMLTDQGMNTHGVFTDRAVTNQRDRLKG